MNYKQLEKDCERFIKGKASDAEGQAAFLGMLNYMDTYSDRSSKEYRSHGLHLLREMVRKAASETDLYPLTREATQVLEERAAAAAAVREQANEMARLERVASNREAIRSRILLSTTPSIDYRPTVEVLGIVTGACVMNQNFFTRSSHMTGGRVGGAENAVSAARQEAEEELEREAHELGADAIVGIDVSVQQTHDRAHLVVMTGTAVLLVPAEEAARVATA